ncbi:hypothetical protein VB796_12450 [Arcicella sp. LKC2W]|uniref:hypothetical protein n=1 Tax=Arcicella sp. LKC2W TaxID=2984198 RepID=UPI002B1FF44B|nr:hypothetical protein [Arcicella sp. LKC2W]MEA5459857.1 hypothetical protein [Arcicella sp. LKC2W]
MTKEQENSVDNQIINTSKTEKIDFRLPAKMKKMLAVTASAQNVKISQLLNHIVEKFFAEQAKAERLAMEEKRIKELQIKQEYALLDEKIKHQKSDFQIDEASPKLPIQSKEDNSFFKFIFWIVLLTGAYFGWKYLQRQNEKKQKQLNNQWQSQQNSHHLKVDSKPSDKQSDKSVGQL